MASGITPGVQTDISSIRARMHEDHRTLHGLLVILAREARSARENNAGKAHVRLALTAVRDALSLHLDDEDREIIPRLRSATADGASLATRIANAHEAQRASATALVEDADDCSTRNIADLAEEIAWFVTGLERDMELEEAAWSRAATVAEDTSEGSHP